MPDVALPIRLLLVDDQSIMLDGLHALLSSYPEFLVVGVAHNGVEAVALTRVLKPRVVLMDISMPEMDGIEATRRIVAADPRCGVLVLSMYHNGAFVHELMGAGASGYLLKNTGRDELHQAITVVANGGRFLGDELKAVLLAVDNGHADAGNMVITPREKEVLLLISEGYSTSEAAAQLKLSDRTVDTHRKNLMHKLGIRNIAGLVKYAMERGWIG